MLRPISVDFCLTFDFNYRDNMLRPISVDLCLTFDFNYRDIMFCPISVDFCLTFDANYICFKNSLKEIHSFAPSFNPGRATC